MQGMAGRHIVALTCRLHTVGCQRERLEKIATHHQRFAYVLLGVVFMRLDQARNQRLAGSTEVTLVERASSPALVFGVANAARFANANFSAYAHNNLLRQGF
jgi:hypothetical protein